MTIPDRPGRALAADAAAVAAQWSLALGNIDSEVAVLLDPAAAALWTPASELAAVVRIHHHAQTLLVLAAAQVQGAAAHGR